MFRRRQQLTLRQQLRRWLWPRIGWRRTGQYLLKRTVRLSDTPHSIAAGIACGVATSFTPFVGFHLLSTFLLCMIVRGNYLAGAIGTLVGNPWTFPFIWLAIYELGTTILGTSAAQPVEQWDVATFLVKVEAVFWPMVVGSLPLALIAGLASYFPLVRVIAAYQEARRHRRAKRRQSRLDLDPEGAPPGLSLP